jgi:hypothetical protein
MTPGPPLGGPAARAAEQRAPAHAVGDPGARTAHLAERERTLAVREQELAERKRILEAEFHAFRSVPMPAAAPGSASTPPRAESSQAVPSGFSWWRWLRRVIAEPLRRTVEDNR